MKKILLTIAFSALLPAAGIFADDNPDFANTLTSYIEEDDELEIIAIARDGKEAVEMKAMGVPAGWYFPI